MESGTKLYSVNVQGFSKEFTEERIKDLLSKFGEVVECRFVGPSLKAPHHEKTRAIVKFTSKMEAATAIARLDKQPPFFLSVDWTGSQPENEPCIKLDGRGDRGHLSVLYGRGSVGPKRYRGRSMDSNNTRDPGHPLYVSAARPEPCANCFQEGRLRCSRCKTWYCTVVCQENHWTRHRDRCFAPPPLENPDGSIYEAELDVSNIKIVRNNDAESSSDEVFKASTELHVNNWGERDGTGWQNLYAMDRSSNSIGFHNSLRFKYRKKRSDKDWLGSKEFGNRGRQRLGKISFLRLPE